MSNTLASIVSYKKYGVQRSVIQDISQNSFYLHQQPLNIQECFKSKHLVYWSGEFILERIKNGVILGGTTTSFHVHFMGDLTRGDILANKEEQFALSFRIPQKEFALGNFVLIAARSGTLNKPAFKFNS